jgi:photosystem II stability/assembly factor-like uncharacterized protein
MLLKRLSEAFAVSSREDEVREILRQELKEVTNEIRTDVLGNLIANNKFNEGMPKVMLCAHMDEIGLMVTYIEDNGVLRFESVGGIDQRVLVSKAVRIGRNKIPGVIGAKAIHLQEPDERKKILKIRDLYIDIGAKDKLGWIAGQGDKVFRTVDGGKSWIPVDTSHVPGPKYHYDVVFTDEKVGYISGLQHIWGTTDSGCSWSRIWNVHEDGRWDKMSKVISMFPLSPDKIWAVGDHNLSMTMEGYGERFVKHANPIGGGICVYFLDSKRGFVSGVLGRIWRTLDGGVTWEMKQIADDTIYQVQFFNENIGYAAGKKGSIFVTNDGGDTWQYKDTGFNETLRALVVLSETTALVAGDGGLMLRTDDEGKSWKKISIPS